MTARPSKKLVPTAREQAERLCSHMTLRWQADRIRGMELLIKAGGKPLDREVFRWLGKRSWSCCFNCYLFTTCGNRERASVSLSVQARRLLGWPAPPVYVSQAKRLAGVRGLVARATNVYAQGECPRKEVRL